MYNDISNFSILKFFSFNINPGKVSKPTMFYRVSFLLARLKSTLMMTLEVLMTLLPMLGSLEGV